LGWAQHLTDKGRSPIAVTLTIEREDVANQRIVAIVRGLEHLHAPEVVEPRRQPKKPQFAAKTSLRSQAAPEVGVAEVTQIRDEVGVGLAQDWILMLEQNDRSV
jgi:hypothetical protein